jgi:N-acetylneuraminic acid mutarotase
LTFEERVKAQEAIERVYYSHQIGARRPFEEAVPREVLEKKVRTYLKQSMALARIWNTPVTAEILWAETERMERGSRMPGRLRELYAALENDPILIQECLVRPLVVRRLVRNFFAYDQTIHAETRNSATGLREGLLGGWIDSGFEHPNRSVLEFVRADAAGELTGARTTAPRSPGQHRVPGRVELSPEALERMRHRLPARVGDIGPLEEERDRFVIQALLAQSEDVLRVSRFTVDKRDRNDWWEEVEGDLDEFAVESVASDEDLIPSRQPEMADSLDLLTSVPRDPCTEDDVWDIPWGINGNMRQQHTAVWTGSHMIVWGGSPSNQGALYDPTIDTWTPTSRANAPSARYGHSAVWTGSTMIVWGGYQPGVNSYTNTGGRYNPFNDAWYPVSTESAPSPRRDHTAVWTGSRMIVWGGWPWSANPALNKGGQYDQASDTWTPTSTTDAPAARHRHTAVWTGSEMIVWGGAGGLYGGALGSGGRYDPAADSWVPTPPTNAPSGRWKHTAIWTGAHMIVWGGQTSPGVYTNTGGRYDPETETWTSLSPLNAPAPRYYHAAVWTGSRMMVWGGLESSDGGYLDTGGQYDPAADAWTSTSTLNAPSARRYHTAVWTGSLMVVFGGIGESTQFKVLADGGRYDPATDTWTPVSTTDSPPARNYHTTVWTGGQMIVWGGRETPGTEVDTGGRYDPTTDTWTPTSTTNAPSVRYSHTAVWTGERMIVWGGQEDLGSGPDTGGRYDPITDTWTPTSTTNAPSGRLVGATAIWTGSHMIVWGGSAGGLRTNTGGRYDPASDSWTPTSTMNAPSARLLHTAVWTGDFMVVWGGQVASGSELDTGGRYDPTTDTWTPTSTTNAPSARSYHTAVWTGNHMIIWGGKQHPGSAIPFNTGGRYDPIADTWTPTSITGAPVARYNHTAVWTGTLMVVWGGTDWDFNDLKSGGRYQPTIDTWTLTSEADAPAASRYHTAIWFDDFMVIWGGVPYHEIDLVGNGGWYMVGRGADHDGDGVSECDGDCEPGDPTIFPGAPQACDGINNDCLHPSWPALTGTNEFDDDGDGFTGCAGDCDNANPNTYPGAPQICDLLNNDCNDSSWPAPPADEVDGDGDGFALCNGECDDTNPFCTTDCTDQDNDGFCPTSDCDDGQAAVYPGAPQVCLDGRNNDCNHPSWPSLTGTNEVDDDGDGSSECTGDCDDTNPNTYPGAPQICDLVNNDCNDSSWPAPPADEVDDDGDGFALCNGECDDTNANTFPGAAEVNDGADNQCPGDEGFGLVDEISGVVYFEGIPGIWRLRWPGQTDGAAYVPVYEVLRSTRPDFAVDCTTFPVVGYVPLPVFLDSESPLEGEAFYYLVRAVAPNMGSWGADSSGVERNPVCGEPVETFSFVDTAGDDVETTSLWDFFSPLDVSFEDYIFFEIEGNSATLGAWCVWGASFYVSSYLTFAPTSGTTICSVCQKWYRPQGGTWTGPVTTDHGNFYGTRYLRPYSWISEYQLGGLTLGIDPGGPDDCEVREYPGCGDGTWRLTIRVDPSRLAACGF